MKFFEIVDYGRVLVRSQALREAKARGRLPFVTIPTKKGPGLLEILSHEDGLAIYGAFVLLAAAAADLEVRGRFVRHGRPMTAPEIARLALIPANLIEDYLRRLGAAGWVRSSEFTSEPCSELNSEASSDGRRSEDEDEDEDEAKTSTAPSPGDLAESWNRNRGPLPEIRLPISSGRARHARARLAEVPEIMRWGNAIARLAASSFANGGGSTGWRADFDFLVKPDTLAKIEEGKYDDRKPASPTAARYGADLNKGDQ